MTLAERIDRVVRRSRAFYAATSPGHLLVKCRVPADRPGLPPLNQFDLDRQLGEWLDANLADERPAWEAREDLDDDYLPAICPHFGIAEHSAWLGMDVRLQEDTCLPLPAIQEPADLDRLTLNVNNRWFRYMKEGYAHLRRRQDGRFLLGVRGTMAPMDLANALRGDNFFLDVLTDPEFVHRLMTFCTRALRWYYPQLASWADRVEDGQVFSFGGWMGPNAIGHLSNDAAVLCGPDVYEQFGLPYEREQVAGYETVLYHVHNEKMHFIPRLVTLPGLSLLEVAADPQPPPPIRDLARIFATTGQANLRLVADSAAVREHLGELVERNVFLEVRCHDIDDARDIVRRVRSASKSLDGLERPPPRLTPRPGHSNA